MRAMLRAFVAAMHVALLPESKYGIILVCANLHSLAAWLNMRSDRRHCRRGHNGRHRSGSVAADVAAPRAALCMSIAPYWQP
jgi:hypothetical protein